MKEVEEAIKRGPEEFRKWLQEKKGSGKGKTKGKGKESWNDRTQRQALKGPEAPADSSGWIGRRSKEDDADNDARKAKSKKNEAKEKPAKADKRKKAEEEGDEAWEEENQAKKSKSKAEAEAPKEEKKKKKKNDEGEDKDETKASTGKGKRKHKDEVEGEEGKGEEEGKQNKKNKDANKASTGKGKKKHEDEAEEEEGEGEEEGKQNLKRLRHMSSSKIREADSPKNETKANRWKQEKLTNMKSVRFYKPFPEDARPPIRKRIVKLRQVTLDSMPTVRFSKWPGKAEKGKGKGKEEENVARGQASQHTYQPNQLCHSFVYNVKAFLLIWLQMGCNLALLFLYFLAGQALSLGCVLCPPLTAWHGQDLSFAI